MSKPLHVTMCIIARDIQEVTAWLKAHGYSHPGTSEDALWEYASDQLLKTANSDGVTLAVARVIRIVGVPDETAH